jgi:hypothetical protein
MRYTHSSNKDIRLRCAPSAMPYARTCAPYSRAPASGPAAPSHAGDDAHRPPGPIIVQGVPARAPQNGYWSRTLFSKLKFARFLDK